MHQTNSKLRFRTKSVLTGWSFVLLAVILIFVFYFYPMLQALILSFQTGTGSNLTFTGFDNYSRLLSDKTFIVSVKNTFIYLLVQVPLMIILALFISVLLNDSKLRFKGFSGRRSSCPVSLHWLRILWYSSICSPAMAW